MDDSQLNTSRPRSGTFRPDRHTGLSRHAVGGGTCWLDNEAIERLDPSVLGESILGIVEALARGESLQHEMLQENRRTSVQVVTIEQRRWVVKRYRHRAGSLNRALRRSPVWREWRGARDLRRAGRRVYSIVAILDQRGLQSLIYPFVEGSDLRHWLRGLRGPGVGNRAAGPPHTALARSIGHQMGSISAAGFISFDYRARNLIVDEPCASGGAEPMIIDAARIRRRRKNGQVLSMLATFVRHDGVFWRASIREAITCRARLSRAIRHWPRRAAGAAAPWDVPS